MNTARGNELLDRAIAKAKAAGPDQRVTDVLTDGERKAVMAMVVDTQLPAKDGNDETGQN